MSHMTDMYCIVTPLQRALVGRYLFAICTRIDVAVAVCSFADQPRSTRSTQTHRWSRNPQIFETVWVVRRCNQHASRTDVPPPSETAKLSC
jgi:hypothetical protein